MATMTFPDEHKATVSQALLSPVRKLALEQAEAEREWSPELSAWTESPEEGEKRRFAEAELLIRLSREAVDLPADDNFGDWRRLVDTERDGLESQAADAAREPTA